MSLPPKHQRFVDEYLVDLNATQAAIRAGYSERSAGNQGNRLLKSPDVMRAIRAAQQARAERMRIAADRVVEELARIAFANMADYMRTTDEGDAFVDLSQLTREQASAISEVIVEDFRDGRGEKARDVRRIKFKLLDKRQALSELGKHLGLFAERREDTGEADTSGEGAASSASERLIALIEAIAASAGDRAAPDDASMRERVDEESG